MTHSLLMIGAVDTIYINCFGVSVAYSLNILRGKFFADLMVLGVNSEILSLKYIDLYMSNTLRVSQW